MASYTVKQTVVENLNADLDGKQPAGDYPTNASLTESLQSNLLNYTTNRILEIPQDIKLEINDGNLTLKAGSKLRRLTGEEYVVKNDFSLNTSYYGFNQPCLIFPGSTNNGVSITNLETPNINICLSGTAIPTSTTYQYCWFFKTDTKEYYWTTDKGATWERRTYAEFFPIAIAEIGAEKWTTIDQIFNGFGYIGSTLFLLPGVKTVVPDGRNDDGTCKNKAPSTVTSVKTETISRADTAYMFTNYASSVIAIHHYICSKTKPTVPTTTLWYNPETNLPSQVLSDGTVMTPYEEIPLAKFTSDSTGRITSFEPYTVDSIVNSNASNFSQAGRSYLSGLGMPSNKYIDLTLGASGATYTAPANGWFTLHKGANSVGQYVYMYTTGIDIGTCFNVSSGTDIPSYFLPVKAGATVKIDYTLGGTTKQFRFIYAQGDQ